MSGMNSTFVSGDLGLGQGPIPALIKLKLVHARGFSVLLPDLIVAEVGGWKWFQPKFFTACLLSFLDGHTEGTTWIDLREQGPRLSVRFSSHDFIRRFDDGAQLYRCVISDAPGLASFAAGTCSVSDDHDILLDLFHHTTEQACEAIKNSGYLRPSAWNVQGTKKLENVGYVYFTSLRAIESDNDLRRIAMASDGEIAFLPTNATSTRDLVRIKVYRESTANRTATVKAAVPVEAIASQHVYRHAPYGNAVYYEICHPEILRVGMVPGAVLPISDDRVIPGAGNLKRFDYVVLGDAGTAEGLTAPYDEENTGELFLVERCETETIFEFWERNSNAELHDGRAFERMTFQPLIDDA